MVLDVFGSLFGVYKYSLTGMAQLQTHLNLPMNLNELVHGIRNR